MYRKIRTSTPGCFGGGLTHDAAAADCKACQYYAACGREARKRRKSIETLGPAKLPTSLLRTLRQSMRRRETFKQRARRVAEEVKELKAHKAHEEVLKGPTGQESAGDDGK